MRLERSRPGRSDGEAADRDRDRVATDHPCLVDLVPAGRREVLHRERDVARLIDARPGRCRSPPSAVRTAVRDPGCAATSSTAARSARRPARRRAGCAGRASTRRGRRSPRRRRCRRIQVAADVLRRRPRDRPRPGRRSGRMPLESWPRQAATRAVGPAARRGDSFRGDGTGRAARSAAAAAMIRALESRRRLDDRHARCQDRQHAAQLGDLLVRFRTGRQVLAHGGRFVGVERAEHERAAPARGPRRRSGRRTVRWSLTSTPPSR